MYFYQSDVDNLVQHQNELVEKLKRGDVSPAYEMFKLYLQRMDERVGMVDALLAVPPDYTLQEEMVVDRDSSQYAANEADAKDKWRKRIKYELLSLKADKTEGQAARDKLSRRYHSLAKRSHQTDTEELLEMYLTSMTTSFDPHTDYMSPSTVENFDIIMKLKLEGIGAALQFVDGYTVVNKIIPGGAAEKDKRLKVEDKIVGVGQGKDGELADVVDMKLSDVVKLIRGAKGTVVRLQVISTGSPERKIYAITREEIELKDSEAHAQIFPAGHGPDGQPYRIGVIDLPSFYMDMEGAKQGLPDFKSTTRDLKRILDGFKSQAVDAVVLDLRKDGGGSLTEAINATGLFTGEGPVVQVKDADGRVQVYPNTDAAVWAGPMMVLTSKFSASASEILAGAIQDYHRGLIVGDHTTHGKGTVQSLLDLGQQLYGPVNPRPMGALKITMQQFYRPDGDSTQRRGVLADVELPSITTHLDVGEADLEYSLAFDHINPAGFRPFNFVRPELVREIHDRSAARIAKSADFQRVDREIARYKDQKSRKTVTLNEKAFMAERAEVNADKEEEKKIEELNNPENSKIVRDYYMNEVLDITADYIDVLSKAGQVQFAGPRQVPVPQ
jgi:carboxyl-terminal processing protease